MAQAEISRPGGARPGGMQTSASRIGTAGPIDQIFQGVVTGVSGFVIVILAGLVLLLVLDAWPSIQRYGPGFITRSAWDPVKQDFGAWPYIYGTLFSSFLGLLIATPI